MALVDKCVHHWTMDEESGPSQRVDSHGENDLSVYSVVGLSNPTLASAIGVLGNAAQVNPTVLPHHLVMETPYDPGVGDFSLSFWYRMDGATGAHYYILTGGTGNGIDGFVLQFIGSTINTIDWV